MSRENPNLKRVITNLRGMELPVTIPRKEDIERIKKEKDIKDVMIDDLPRETVQDVILNCLSAHKPTDKRDIFLVNKIANWVLQEPDEEEGYGELKDKLFNFLVDEVLPNAIIYAEEEKSKDDKKEKGDKNKGIYYGWIIAQVYDELGIKE